MEEGQINMIPEVCSQNMQSVNVINDSHQMFHFYLINGFEVEAMSFWHSF